VLRWTVGHEEVREAMEHVIGAKLPLNHNGEAFSTEFIYDIQYLDWATIVSTVCHEIIGPDMMAMGGPEPDARPIVEPETSAFGLFLRNLQPLLAPDAFHPLMIDSPTPSSEQGRNPSITVAPIGFGKFDNFLSEPLFSLCPFGYEPLS
jgi:hypothetical protein